jgi:DNA repair protein RecN (Recombination protein N)
MLRFLSISNLAVIERLELEFEPGLNVLTGETGAGKSILVGAVGLLVGGRASAELVRTGEGQATIEAIFEEDDGRELIVRREISAQTGRSRAFLNGSIATSTALRDAAARLVDLHGQHEHQVLLDPAAHLDLLDAFAGLNSERARVSSAFVSWQQLRVERERLAAGDRDKGRRAEFLEFQLAEIHRAAPKPGEDVELAATRLVLANADRLQRLCSDAYTSLYEGDTAALGTLAAVWKRLGELAGIDPQFAPYLAARDVVKSQLEDLAYFLRSYAAAIDASPSRLQEVEDRLAVLERLKKKYGPGLEDVIATAASLRLELESLQNSDARAAEVEARLERVRATYGAEAAALSQLRRQAAVEFTQRLERSLKDFAMPHTRCDVRFLPDRGEAGWTERGNDEGEFYLSPNPGEDLRPLARIASGGELSRIMLALKTLASTDAPGKTLIFDEVDAGIGGTVADVVGARLRDLGHQFQVLCITHLPQIAAYGTTQYRIAKSVKDARTVTDVRKLSVREREEELARMIAGAEVSASVRASAREMLKRSSAR